MNPQPPGRSLPPAASNRRGAAELERAIFSASRERVLLAWGLAVTHLLSVAALMAAALLFGAVLQGVVVQHRPPATAGDALWFAVAIAARMLLTRLAAHLGNRLGLSLTASISEEVTRLSAASPLPGAEIAYLSVDGADAMVPYASRFIPAAIAAATATPILLLFTLVLIPIAFAEMMLGLLALPALMIVIGKATRAKADEALEATIHINTLYLDTLTGIAVLKAFAKASLQRDAIASAAAALKTRTMTVLRTAFASGVALDLLVAVIVALVAVSIGIRLNDGSLRLATGAAVLFVTPDVFAPLRMAALQYHATQDARAVAARIAAAGAQAAPSAGATGGQVVPVTVTVKDSGSGTLLELDRFSVHLPSGAVTQPVSVAAGGGQIIAVSGRSGAGKTAWLEGLAGLNTTEGRLRQAGSRTQRHLEPGTFTYLPAEPAFASGTVLDNISLLDGPADLAYLEELADLLGAQALTGRLGGELLPAAANLSSGERQKLALLRAFCSRRQAVLFDEPSAHLDTESTLRLSRGLRALAGGIVIVLATHSPILLQAASIEIALPGDLP